MQTVSLLRRTSMGKYSLEAFVTNFPAMCTLVAWFFAQFLKVIVTLVKEKVFKPKILLFSLGGMPSSHSASVCSLWTACAIEYGFNSAAFAISGLLAMVVMTDAMGVRWETGEQSKIINKLVKEIFTGTSEEAETALKELVGHTPIQVFVGAFVGIAVPFVMMLIMK